MAYTRNIQSINLDVALLEAIEYMIVNGVALAVTPEIHIGDVHMLDIANAIIDPASEGKQDSIIATLTSTNDGIALSQYFDSVDATAPFYDTLSGSGFGVADTLVSSNDAQTIAEYYDHSIENSKGTFTSGMKDYIEIINKRLEPFMKQTNLNNYAFERL